MKEVTAVKTAGAIPYKIRGAARWAWRAALCALALLLAAGALAEPANGALTISFEAESRPVAGASFSVYRVADWNGGSFALSGAFADYPVEMENLDSEGWGILAGTLAGYAASDGLAPDFAGITGEDGRATFDGLSLGLYLVVGEPILREGRVCHPQPALVALPARDDAGEWSTDVSVEIKDGVPGQGVIDLTVMKIWQDGNSASRPGEVTVELLGNGALFDTVKLNKDNSWRYTWKNLDAETVWQAVEKPVPDGYTVKIDREDALITITNTAPSSSGGGGSKLPQTGVVWWPVPVLTTAGMILFAWGWILRRKGERQE